MTSPDVNTLIRALSAAQADLDSAKCRIQQLENECKDWVSRDVQKQGTIERLRHELAEMKRLHATGVPAPGRRVQ